MFGKLSIVIVLFSVVGGTLGEISVSAFIGQTANIECAYAAETIFNQKYFFKMSPGRHMKSMYTLKGRRFLQDGRVSISNDFQRRILQVSIDNLSENDSGLYACAVGKGHSLETFAVVRLSVMAAPQAKVNTIASPVPTVRSLLKHTDISNSFMVTAQTAVTKMSKQKESSTIFSDWRRTALVVGLSVPLFLIVALLSFGLILFYCLKPKRRPMQNNRHKRSVSKKTNKNENDQKTENLYHQSDVCSKRQDSIYQDLKKQQLDSIYQCLNNRTTS